MMGGKKKPSLKQMEMTADKKDETQKREKKSSGIVEKKTAGIIPPDLKNDKIIAEVKKMKALTPYVVASRFNIRLSVARDMLDELAERGIIEYVSASKYLKIYKPHD